jgi:hypothetical protein
LFISTHAEELSYPTNLVWKVLSVHGSSPMHHLWQRR